MSNGSSINETADIRALCEEFKTLNPKMIALKARIDFIKRKLSELSGGKEVLSAGVSVKTTQRKGSIDYKQIKGIQKMMEDGTIEKYRKDSSSVTKIQVVG